MEYFVSEHSIVRKIWGSTDTILFIFAGAAAEFALNKAVDWLYFTGRLPADPLGRLFSTVTYSQKILFSTTDEAYAAIDQITAIHQTVEQNRGSRIPDWAYRDVLYLLIDYTIRSFELLERKLAAAEKEEIFDTFYKLGERMRLTGLPETYQQWKTARETQLNNDLENSRFTEDLYRQYRKHLGGIRYMLLKQVQARLAPGQATRLLSLKKNKSFLLLLAAYKLCKRVKIEQALRNSLLPAKYKAQILTWNVTKK